MGGPHSVASLGCLAGGPLGPVAAVEIPGACLVGPAGGIAAIEHYSAAGGVKGQRVLAADGRRGRGGDRPPVALDGGLSHGDVAGPGQGIGQDGVADGQGNGVDAGHGVGVGRAGLGGGNRVTKVPQIAARPGRIVEEEYRQGHRSAGREGRETSHRPAATLGVELPNFEQAQITAAGLAAAALTHLLADLQIALGHGQNAAVGLGDQGWVRGCPVSRGRDLVVKTNRPEPAGNGLLVILNQSQSGSPGPVLHRDCANVVGVLGIAPGRHQAIETVGHIDPEDDLAAVAGADELVI